MMLIIISIIIIVLTRTQINNIIKQRRSNISAPYLLVELVVGHDGAREEGRQVESVGQHIDGREAQTHSCGRRWTLAGVHHWTLAPLSTKARVANIKHGGCEEDQRVVGLLRVFLHHQFLIIENKNKTNKKSK